MMYGVRICTSLEAGLCYAIGWIYGVCHALFLSFYCFFYLLRGWASEPTPACQQCLLEDAYADIDIDVNALSP